MASYLDFTKCTEKDFFNAIRGENLKLAIIVCDHADPKIKEMREIHNKAIEWITQCAMINLEITRKEFNNKYAVWKRSFDKD